MLEGNRFFPDTGMPILKSARRIVVLAVELPEPFTVPTVIEKSFVILSSISAPSCVQADCASPTGRPGAERADPYG